MRFVFFLSMIVPAVFLESVFPSFILYYVMVFLLVTTRQPSLPLWLVLGGMLLDLLSGWPLGGSSLAGLVFLFMAWMIEGHFPNRFVRGILMSGIVVLLPWAQHMIVVYRVIPFPLFSGIVWFVFSLVIFIGSQHRLRPSEGSLFLRWRRHGHA